MMVKQSTSWHRAEAIMDYLSRVLNPITQRAHEKESALLSLPPELLYRIMPFLQPRDVARVRLTCSLLAAVGIESLIPEVKVYYTKQSLSKLKPVSEHPVLSKKVRALCFHGDRISPYDTAEDFNESNECTAFVFRGFEEPDRCHIDGSDFRFAQELLQEQTEIEEAQLEQTAFRDFFKACANVDRVYLYIQRFPGLSEGNTPLYIMHRGVLFAGDHAVEMAGLHQMEALFRAAAEAQRKIKRFTGHRLGYQLLSEDATSKLGPLMSSLHSLRLTVYFPNPASRDETEGINWTEDDMEEAIFMTIQYLQTGAFYRLLAGIPDLHTLKLNLPFVPQIEAAIDEANTIAVLPEIVGTHTWPKLRDFAVNNIGAKEDELVDFVLRHKSTLRRISLSRMTLSEGNWESVFTRIAGKCPRLHKVKLSGDFIYTVGEQRWCIYKFALPTEKRKIAIAHEALEAYIKDGGVFPDERVLYEEECRQREALGIAERELEDPDPFEDYFEDYKPRFETFEERTLKKRPEDDGGYDSDGSHISYGSDDFDWEI